MCIFEDFKQQSLRCSDAFLQAVYSSKCTHTHKLYLYNILTAYGENNIITFKCILTTFQKESKFEYMYNVPVAILIHNQVFNWVATCEE